MRPGKAIYTVGYSGMQPCHIAGLARDLGAIVLDCRSSPRSRKAGFSGTALEALLGDRYAWGGDLYGGRTKTKPEHIRALCRTKENLILLCLEANPDDCHRHHAIAVPLLGLSVDCRHICQDDLWTSYALASEVQAAIETEEGAEIELRWLP